MSFAQMLQGSQLADDLYIMDDVLEFDDPDGMMERLDLQKAVRALPETQLLKAVEAAEANEEKELGQLLYAALLKFVQGQPQPPGGAGAGPGPAGQLPPGATPSPGAYHQCRWGSGGRPAEPVRRIAATGQTSTRRHTVGDHHGYHAYAVPAAAPVRARSVHRCLPAWVCRGMSSPEEVYADTHPAASGRWAWWMDARLGRRTEHRSRPGRRLALWGGDPPPAWRKSGRLDSRAYLSPIR